MRFPSWALFLCVICQGLMLSTAAAQTAETRSLSPRHAERMLSQHYENLASEALENVIPKDKYKLLIDVNLEDATQLNEVSTDNFYSPLPGTTANNPSHFQNVLLGRLESLDQKRSVLIIFDPKHEKSLSKDSNLHELISEAITGKLKLNLADGSDSINIRTLEISGSSSERSPASIEMPQAEAFNWIKFLAWFVASLSAISLVYFFLRKWKQDSSAATTIAGDDNAKITELDPENSLSEEPLEDEEDEIEDPNAIAPPPKHPEIQTAEAPVSPSMLILPNSPVAKDLVDRVKQLVTDYPKLTSEALQNYLDQHMNKTYRVGYLVELLGFEESLMLFKGVSQKHWKIIGQYMAEYPVSNANPIDLEEAAILYRFLVARIVEHKGLESDMGVFAIEGYSANDLAKVVEPEDDAFVAQFVSGVSDAMAQDILNSFSVSRRANILTILSGIDRLDPEQISYIETTIQQRLSEDGVRPITISNENRIFSSLSNLEPHEEESLFAQMLQSDPGILYRSKRFRLYQEHIEHLRESVLSEELRSYPIESIAQMLKGMNDAPRRHLMKCVSDKKAQVLEDMLGSLEAQPNGPEFSIARREFLDFIYEKFSQGGTSFIDNIFNATNGDNSEAA